MNRPGGNVTGVSFFDVPLSGKRLGVLLEAVPTATRVALLLDPKFAPVATELRELTIALKATARSSAVVHAAAVEELEEAFLAIRKSESDALVVGAGPFFVRQRQRLVELAERFAIPAIYVQREFVLDGGLLSYGTSQREAHYRAGTFVARILNGERPSDIPVEVISKFDLALNAKTATQLKLTIPPTLLARADEVIE